MRLSEVRPIVGAGLQGSEGGDREASLLGQSWPRSGVLYSWTDSILSMKEAGRWVWEMPSQVLEESKQVYLAVVVFSVKARKQDCWPESRFKKQKWNQYLWPTTSWVTAGWLPCQGSALLGPHSS